VLSKIGLEELCQNNFRKIGSEIRISGGKSDLRISEKAAEELGLALGTTVATSLIDAHAGGLALSFCLSGEEGRGRHNLAAADRTRRLSLICGTSTCYMNCSHKPIFVAGVWGPYYSAMIPGFWLNEAGQVSDSDFPRPFFQFFFQKSQISFRVRQGSFWITSFEHTPFI
jgi:ribulose kinase